MLTFSRMGAPRVASTPKKEQESLIPMLTIGAIPEQAKKKAVFSLNLAARIALGHDVKSDDKLFVAFNTEHTGHVYLVNVTNTPFEGEGLSVNKAGNFFDKKLREYLVTYFGDAETTVPLNQVDAEYPSLELTLNSVPRDADPIGEEEPIEVEDYDDMPHIPDEDSQAQW